MLKTLHRITDHKAVRILLLVLAVIVLFCTIDCIRVIGMYEKPLFCLPAITADDGGSGRYVGLLYGFDLKGHLPAVDEGVFWVMEHYRFYLLGFPILRNDIS